MCSRTRENNKNKVGPVIWDTLYNDSGSETPNLRSGLSFPSWREFGRLVFNISTHGNFVFSRVWHDGHPCRRKVLTFSKYLIRYFQTYKHELQKGEHSSGNTVWYWMLLDIVEQKLKSMECLWLQILKSLKNDVSIYNGQCFLGHWQYQ